ncbi:MAG: hypothetical protein M9921_12380 [Fimbriimonadaceae bacterium]|nr:hypothetical protein [Fimbriimonadaceae bacterium]
MFLSAFVGLAFAQVAGSTANEVTVYNQGFALVKEVRNVELVRGRQQVSIVDVASQIETNSVGIRSLTDPNAFEVWEQNYQYDLISPIAILNKAVGQPIRFRRVLPDGQIEVLSGTLISSPTAVVGNQQGGSSSTYNGMVIRADDGRIVLNPSGEIEVSSLPEGLISKPTLVWDLFAQKAGPQAVELSYLTRGTSWNADYVLTLSGTGTADLRGWVTMTNNSGATWKDAKLKLLAGDVQRIQEMARGGMGGGRQAMDAAAKAGFQEESLFEYHLYTLQRPATIRDREIKQLSLLEGKGVKVEKKLIVDSMQNFGTYYPSEGEVGTGNIKPQVRIEFVNSEQNQLGMPLPMGNVKVYQRDASGSIQMLGEDRIDHTPKNERISLVVGRSFDVVAERKRLNFSRTSPRSFVETFEIEIRNRKETPEQVIVLERHFGDWRVTNKSMEFEKLDSTTMRFLVDLKPNESKKVTYTVETRW